MTHYERFYLRCSALALAVFVAAATVVRVSILLSGDWWSLVILLCYGSLFYTASLMWKAGRTALSQPEPRQ